MSVISRSLILGDHPFQIPHGNESFQVWSLYLLKYSLTPSLLTANGGNDFSVCFKICFSCHLKSVMFSNPVDVSGWDRLPPVIWSLHFDPLSISVKVLICCKSISLMMQGERYTCFLYKCKSLECS